MRNVQPGKLVIWAHPHLLRLDEENREGEWRFFSGGAGWAVSQTIARTPRGGTLLLFSGGSSTGWRERFLAVRRQCSRAARRAQRGWPSKRMIAARKVVVDRDSPPDAGCSPGAAHRAARGGQGKGHDACEPVNTASPR